MTDERCAPGRHLGEDLEGRCSSCGNRIERPGVLLTMVVLVAVVLATVLTVAAILSWWSG